MADLFVFPSISDTFGMVVLEAQACGLPAVVSDIGGPKEIVIDGETGSVVSANKLEEWVDQICQYIKIIQDSPEEYLKIRESCRINAVKYNWDSVLNDILMNKTINDDEDVLQIHNTSEEKNQKNSFILHEC